MSSISERLGISNEIRELKFGKSFTNTSNNNSKYVTNKNSFNNNDNGESFHTIRYDFKPVSVDTSQTASIEFNEKNKITVTAPNVPGSGMPCTVYKGSRKPHLKECVLVYDHETGDLTLERLTNNIVVKKTRAEQGSSKSNIVGQQRPITPANLTANNNNQKSVSPKLNNQLNGTTKSPPISNTTNNLATSSTNLSNNTITQRSPIDKLNQQKDSQSLNSMPIFNSTTLNTTNTTNTNGLNRNASFSEFNVGILSSSSSSSSSSEDDDDDDDSSSSSSSGSSSSEDEEENEKIKKQPLTTTNLIKQQPTLNMSASSSSEMDSDDEDDHNKSNNLNNNLINSLNNGLSNVGISNNNSNVGFSMPKLSDGFSLKEDLQLSESASDSD